VATDRALALLLAAQQVEPGPRLRRLQACKSAL